MIFFNSSVMVSKVFPALLVCKDSTRLNHYSSLLKSVYTWNMKQANTFSSRQGFCFKSHQLLPFSNFKCKQVYIQKANRKVISINRYVYIHVNWSKDVQVRTLNEFVRLFNQRNNIKDFKFAYTEYLSMK